MVVARGSPYPENGVLNNGWVGREDVLIFQNPLGIVNGGQFSYVRVSLHEFLLSSLGVVLFEPEKKTLSLTKISKTPLGDDSKTPETFCSPSIPIPKVTFCKFFTRQSRKSK